MTATKTRPRKATAKKPAAVKKPAAKKAGKKPIVLPPLDVCFAKIKIVGISRLVMHKWSEKAKKMMRDKKEGKAKQKKYAIADPKAEYLATIYRDEDNDPAFPAIAFKQAMVRAAKSAGMAMTDARGAFHIAGEFVKIKGKHRMREDMVRVATGGADIRWRAEFPDWSTVLTIHFDRGQISAEQLVDLIRRAGFSVGVGESRPEKNGAWGMFRVSDYNEFDGDSSF